jgi:hypothetical protein
LPLSSAAMISKKQPPRHSLKRLGHFTRLRRQISSLEITTSGPLTASDFGQEFFEMLLWSAQRQSYWDVTQAYRYLSLLLAWPDFPIQMETRSLPRVQQKLASYNVSALLQGELVYCPETSLVKIFKTATQHLRLLGRRPRTTHFSSSSMSIRIVLNRSDFYVRSTNSAFAPYLSPSTPLSLEKEKPTSVFVPTSPLPPRCQESKQLMIPKEEALLE